MVEKARLEGVEPDKVTLPYEVPARVSPRVSPRVAPRVSAGVMLTNVIVIAGLRQDLNAAEDVRG
eukprot:1345401-Rhodomonas_salina.1